MFMTDPNLIYGKNSGQPSVYTGSIHNIEAQEEAKKSSEIMKKTGAATVAAAKLTGKATIRAAKTAGNAAAKLTKNAADYLKSDDAAEKMNFLKGKAKSAASGVGSMLSGIRSKASGMISEQRNKSNDEYTDADNIENIANAENIYDDDSAESTYSDQQDSSVSDTNYDENTIHYEEYVSEDENSQITENQSTNSVVSSRQESLPEIKTSPNIPQYTPNPVSYGTPGYVIQKQKSNIALIIVIVILVLIIGILGGMFFMMSRDKKPEDTGKKSPVSESDSESKTDKFNSIDGIINDELQQKAMEEIASSFYKAANSALTEMDEESYDISGYFIVSSDKNYNYNISEEFDIEYFTKKFYNFYADGSEFSWMLVVNDGSCIFSAFSDLWDNEEFIGSYPGDRMATGKFKLNDDNLKTLSDYYEHFKSLKSKLETEKATENPIQTESSVNISCSKNDVNQTYADIVKSMDFPPPNRGFILDLNNDGVNEMIIPNTDNMNFVMYYFDGNSIQSCSFGNFIALDNFVIYQVDGEDKNNYIYYRDNYAYKSLQGYYSFPSADKLDIFIDYPENNGKYSADWTIDYNKTENYAKGNESVDTFYGQPSDCHNKLLSAFKNYGFKITENSKYTEVKGLYYDELINKLSGGDNNIEKEENSKTKSDAPKATASISIEPQQIIGNGTELLATVSGNYSYFTYECYWDGEGKTNQLLTSGTSYNKSVTISGGSTIEKITFVVTPYNADDLPGDTITSNYTGPWSYVFVNKYGQINAPGGGPINGYATSYILNGGEVAYTRTDLMDKWHVTAVNLCTFNGIIWYELYDTDDGDYYGWVDENHIVFY